MYWAKAPKSTRGVPVVPPKTITSVLFSLKLYFIEQLSSFDSSNNTDVLYSTLCVCLRAFALAELQQHMELHTMPACGCVLCFCCPVTQTTAGSLAEAAALVSFIYCISEQCSSSSRSSCLTWTDSPSSFVCLDLLTASPSSIDWTLSLCVCVLARLLSWPICCLICPVICVNGRYDQTYVFRWYHLGLYSCNICMFECVGNAPLMIFHI